VSGDVRGWGRLLRVGLLAGALLVAGSGCVSQLRDFAERYDLDLEGVVSDLNEQQRAQRGGHDPFDGDEDRLRRWCMAWVDAQQGPLRDGYFLGNVRKQDSIQDDPANMEPHYDIVWAALLEAYDLAPEEIKEHLYELGEMIKHEEVGPLARHGWNMYRAVESGELDLGLSYAARKARWQTPIEQVAEAWCWEDADLRGPLD
jgi:hypothetical protein